MHSRNHGEHHGAMRVHASLGTAGGAGGVGHDAEIVGAGRDRAGAEVARHGVVPQRRRRIADGLARRRDQLRDAQVGRLFQIVRVRRDDDAFQLPADQRLHLRIELLGDERGLGVAVEDILAQLVRQVHRIDRHHHRVGAHDGVVRNDELRAVLHEEQHAIALLYAAFALEEPGHALGFVFQLGEGDRGIVVDQIRLFRIAMGRNLEVVKDVRLRYDEVSRHVFGPVGKMTVGHGSSSDNS